MTVLKLVTGLPRRTRLRDPRFQVKSGVSKKSSVITAKKDYNGMPASEWKAAVMKDVAERFGPIPSDLVDVTEAAW